MTHPLHPRFHWLLLGALGGIAASAIATGCSSKGYSPDCPDDVELYNVRDAGQSKTPTQSINKDCWTKIGHATSGSGGTGNPSPKDAGSD